MIQDRPPDEEANTTLYKQYLASQVKRMLAKDCGASDEEEKLERVLNGLYGPRDSFREILTNTKDLLRKVCDYAEYRARRKRCEPWSIIGEITNHGSGVSAAIYELYRKRD